MAAYVQNIHENGGGSGHMKVNRKRKYTHGSGNGGGSEQGVVTVEMVPRMYPCSPFGIRDIYLGPLGVTQNLHIYT